MVLHQENPMNISTLTRETARPTAAQVVVFIAGMAHLLTGVAMLAAPAWFFATIGTFPPFNRHYAGDAGAFLLPSALALVWAARDPLRHRELIAVGAGFSVIHAGVHWRDSGLAPQTLLLVLLAILLVASWVLVQVRSSSGSSSPNASR
jgi:hypothetical protein